MDTLKILLLAVGGYLALQYFSKSGDDVADPAAAKAATDKAAAEVLKQKQEAIAAATAEADATAVKKAAIEAGNVAMAKQAATAEADAKRIKELAVQALAAAEAILAAAKRAASAPPPYAPPPAAPPPRDLTTGGITPDPYQASIDLNYAKSISDTLMFNVDEWNWYREQKTGMPTNIDLFTPGNREEQISAQVYHGRRIMAGLSGLARRSWGIV